jgi:transcriptional regulator with XRE-family HTH domain
MAIYEFSAYQRRMLAPSEVDRMVGEALRAERVRQHRTEAEFAFSTAVSVDQLHRFECGADRISAATLYNFARSLRVPVKRFFEQFG